MATAAGFLYFTTLLWLLGAVFMFNVDVKDPYLFERQTDNYFGYSVALLKPNWLVVGAPKADNGPGKVEHGVVFKCNAGSNSNQCSQMGNFDTIPTQKINDNGTIRDSDIKKGQMFGATVRAFKDRVMACAPNYIYTGSLGRRAWTTGKCEIRSEKTPEDDNLWNPCKGEISKSAQFGYCQVGLDAAVSPDESKVVSDAIGINFWMGRLIFANIDSIGNAYTPPDDLFGSTYMGYAVAAGSFTKDKQLGVAGGAPRGNAMEGMVIVYYPSESKFVVMTTISNPEKQGGAYFGGSLAAPDLNGDGFSDLVVGAPFYSIKSNEGAVYVYLNNKNNALNLLPNPLYGDSERGAQFGFAVASVGDLNGDTYGDVAVGAPYGGEDKKGVVYLYYGTRVGINSKYSQKIRSSQAGSNLLTFGHSLTGGVDIDTNGYPDIAIGSYSSNAAVFLRSRPVYNVIGKIELSVTKLSLTNSKWICTAPDGKQYKCVDAKLCFIIQGRAGFMQGNLNYTFEIDKGRVADKRGFLFSNGNKVTSVSTSLTANGRTCQTLNVFVYNRTTDVFFPLIMALSYKYIEPTPCNLCGVSNVFLPSATQARVTYVKGCGSDDICDADLSVKLSVIIPGGYSEIRLGVVDSITVRVEVSNKGENAYVPKFSMKHDSSLSIMDVLSVTDTKPLWDDDRTSTEGISDLTFTFAKPLIEGPPQILDIKISVYQVSYLTTSVTLDASVTTESNDKVPGNDRAVKTVDVITIADLAISGNANPEQVKYFKNSSSLIPQWASLTQTVLLQNQGPSSVEMSKVNIGLPYKKEEDYLLNLMSVEVEGAGACTFSQAIIDPMDLKNYGKNTTAASSRSRRDAEQTCQTATCVNIVCDIGLLERGRSVTIKLKSIVVEATFIQRDITNTRLILYASVNAPGIVSTTGDTSGLSAEIPVTIQEYSVGEGGKTSKSVPWWVIFLSILAGAILIAACVYLLYKKGFFERTKHEQVPQQERDEDLEDF